MLAATEFSVGTIGDATPLTLMLPRSNYESLALIGRAEQSGNPAVFFLGENDGFKWFECGGNDHWKGIQIPNVSIEIDEATVFGPQLNWPKPGCVVRKATHLVVIAEPSQYGKREAVVLHDNLAPSSQSAAFSRWQIVLGTGMDKRVLRSVDAER